LERENGVDAEAVHADIRSVTDQLFQVAQVRSVAGMPDHHARQVNAFFLENPLLVKPYAFHRMRVRRDWYAGLAMRLRRRAQDSLDVLGHARLVRRAFEDSSLDAGISDAFLDVAHKHIDDQLRTAEHRARSTKMKVERRLVVGINPRGHHDVDFGLL